MGRGGNGEGGQWGGGGGDGEGGNGEGGERGGASTWNAGWNKVTVFSDFTYPLQCRVTQLVTYKSDLVWNHTW